MKTAVIYARYSSDNQTEQSIEGQLRVCQEYAKNNDILILDTYIDRAMTGTNDNRADFQRMIKDSARREWDYVLVYKLDRFSRNKYETAIHKKTLRDNGVRLISATEYIPDSPEGIILESMLEGYAEYYSAELSQKIRRGMNESRQKGNYTGGFILFGYKVVDKKILIDEFQAEAVRYMFEQYAKGVIVRNLIADLTRKGIYHRGKPFAKNTVYAMLRNERYIGIYRYKDQVFDNMYPSIVPRDLFEKVRKIIEANLIGSNSKKTVYLFRNKLKCGYCGKPISAETGTARKGDVRHYYKCNGKKYAKTCNKSIVRQDVLEPLIMDGIKRQLKDKEVMDSLVKQLLLAQEMQTSEKSVLKMLSNEKAGVEKALDNLIRAIEQGILTPTTGKRLKELEEQKSRLEKQILIEQNKIAVQLTEKDIRAFYESAIDLNPQAIINNLVQEIILYDDKVIIKFKSPIRTSPDDSQGFSFSRKIVYRRINQKVVEIAMEYVA